MSAERSGPADAVAPDPVELATAEADPSRRIDRYLILAELGRGGMGVVYRAWDPALRRPVAIKMIIDPGSAANDPGAAEVRERFAREARAAAGLRHPGIVAVHEVGAHRGRPFIVMDFVTGETLEALLRREPPEPRRIAELVGAVADALGHAHAGGIIHRDVKPQNVMIDEGGRVVVMDFGLAREQGSSAELTRTGQVLGTLSYMAPEQAAGEIDQQGPPTDVYALGAVLYRALLGAPPFAGHDQVSLIKRILMDDPEPPRAVDATVHPDLETIVLRCLDKEPARRYPDAGAVAAELHRFRRGEAIEARPPTRKERLARWARRHRALAATAGGLGSAVVALLVAGVVLGLLAVREIDRERARALEEADRANRRTAAALAEKGARLLGEARHAEAAVVLDAAVERRFDPPAPDALARRWLAARALAGAPELLARFDLAADGDGDGDDDGEAMPCWASAAVDGGATLAVARGGQIHLVDLERRGGPVVELAHLGPPADADGVARDAVIRALAPVAGGLLAGGNVRPEPGPVQPVLVRLGADAPELDWRGPTGPISALAVASAGRMAAVGAPDPGGLAILDLETGRRRPVEVSFENGVRGVAFDPDDALLVATSLDGGVRLVDVATLRQVGPELRGHASGVNEVAFLERDLFATTSGDRRILLWAVLRDDAGRATGGRVAAALDGHEGGVGPLAVRALPARVADLEPDAPRGPRRYLLASGAMDTTVRLWSIEVASDGAIRARPRTVIVGHGAPVTGVALLDGDRVASVDRAGEVAVHRLPPEPVVLPTGSVDVAALCFDRSGRRLVAACWTHTNESGPARPLLLLSDLDAAQPRRRVLDRHLQGFLAVAASPIEDVIAGGDEKGGVTIHRCSRDGPADPTSLVAASGERVRGLAFLPDGDRLVYGHRDALVVVEVATGDEVARAPLPELEGETRRHAVGALALVPGTPWLAVGSWDRTVRLARIDPLAFVATLGRQASSAAPIAASGDGAWVASGGRAQDRALRLWRVPAWPEGSSASEQEPRALSGPRGSIAAAVFHPSNPRWLLAGSTDGSIGLWDAVEGRRLVELGRHETGGVRALALDPSGRTLASGGRDGSVRLWDLGALLDPAGIDATGRTGLRLVEGGVRIEPVPGGR